MMEVQTFPATPFTTHKLDLGHRVPEPEFPGLPNDIRVKQDEPTETKSEFQDPYKLQSHYAYTPRKIKVFTIGAGFSGLLMAHKFQHRFPDMREIVNHTIFEARSDIGGTWLANHYPGVQCDVPAHIYASFPGQIACEKC